jgi:hypothetical protein
VQGRKQLGISLITETSTQRMYWCAALRSHVLASTGSHTCRSEAISETLGRRFLIRSTARQYSPRAEPAPIHLRHLTVC